ncbi:uncharacterized protein LOC134683414 isoform X2 [Mytilus trossulus]|uniref:uncharacterized protein LOC134683414 isoform X2 n=1 Tax=Mytilus trossulus TaxID=6551 RepID=UPI003003E941
MDIVKVLRKFREEEDPEMEDYDGKCLPTLSKAELTSIAKSKGVKLEELLLLGGIPDSRENMCKLLHFALQCTITIQESKEDEEAGPSNRPDPPRKKRKSNDATGMKALEDKIDKLEKMLEEKKTADEESDLERAKRDVKEEASKGPKENFRMKPWEKNVIFDSDPTNEFIRLASYVNLEGKLLSEKELQIKPDSAEESFSASLIKGQDPSIDNLVFLNPNSFKAGQIHTRVDQWKHIMCNSSQTKEVLDWIENGVNIHNYITIFKGKFWGEKYDHEFPPPRMFNNSNSCIPFIDFITKTITERLRNGSLECVGKVGIVQPPHIVAPLTVEPTKPRLCVNLMYLNNWIKSVPFNLDTLKDIPRIVKTGAYFTSIDDKSGFDNVRLSEESFNLVGFQGGGYYYRCKTLPFGFKLSSYIYHTLNMQPTSYIRKHFSIPIFLYIDDRLVEEVRSEGIEPGIPSALLANYIVCEILTRLGYCLNLTKTIFVPTQSPVFFRI